MNIRSFRREIEKRESQGWKVAKEEYHFKQRGNVEQQLRAAFEEILKNALEEAREGARRGVGRPFMSWGIIEAENGQSFKVTIEGEPPTMPRDPSLN